MDDPRDLGARAGRVRPAMPAEAALITALAIRSKAHWGYTSEQMAIFAAELSVTDVEVVLKRAHVVEEGGEILGFYTLEAQGMEAVELGHLFVEPSRLGEGLGSLLFWHACAQVLASGLAALEILSDPNAAGFYRSHGAVYLCETPSSIPGRTLPAFRMLLAP